MKNKIIFFLLCMLLWTCHGFANAAKLNGNSLNLAKALLLQSEAFEKNGELYHAIENLKLYNKVSGSTAAINDKIKTLETKMEVQANRHFKLGIKYFNLGNIRSARKEFINALKFNPYHEGSLDYLRNRFNNTTISYTVTNGDTPQKIAQKVYRDTSKAYLIDYFATYSDDKKKTLKVGSVLTLPYIDKDLVASFKKSKNKKSAKKVEQVEEQDPEEMASNNQEEMADKDEDEIIIEQDIAKASEYLEQKNYSKSLVLIYKALNSDPTNFDAIELKNSLFYQKGMDMMAEKDYISALNEFSQVNPEYEGLEEAIKKANDFLVEEQLASKNDSAYQKGISLLKQNKHLEALKSFETIDSDYNDISQVIYNLKKTILTLAEQHYKKGVVYYVKEEIEKAITEWEETIKLVPTHKEANENLERAHNLLDKLKAY